MRFNALVPELSVQDIEASRRFYVDVLGFQLEYERREDKFLFLSRSGAQLMLEQTNGQWQTGPLEPPFGRGVNFQIECADLDGLSRKLVLNGYALFREPHETAYRENGTVHSQTELLVQDPDGYLLRFSQAL